MNKSELIETVAAKGSLTLNKSEEVVDLVLGLMTKTLSNNGRVEIRGFGALSVKSYDAYVGRNPKTGEKIDVAAKILPVWRTGMELRNRVDRMRHNQQDMDESAITAG